MIQRFPTRSESRLRRAAKFVLRMAEQYPFEIFMGLFVIGCMGHLVRLLWSLA